MKMTTILAMGVCAAIGCLTTQPSNAQDKPGHEEDHGKIQIPNTKDGILKEIDKQYQELAGTIKANKLSEVHEHAYAIRDLAKALPAKTGPETKIMVENAVKRVSQLAEDLDKSGDAGDQAKTEPHLKKMDAALKTLKEHASM